MAMMDAGKWEGRERRGCGRGRFTSHGQWRSTGPSGIRLLLTNVGFNKCVLGIYSVPDSEQQTKAPELVGVQGAIK